MDGSINNMIAALYVDSNLANPSFMKFGSYDEDGFDSDN
jgi:hypothetical protein